MSSTHAWAMRSLASLSRQLAVVAQELLGIDDHRQALIEAERSELGVVALGEVGVGHGAEAHGAQPLYGGVRVHAVAPCW
jgi:hypothetical protein